VHRQPDLFRPMCGEAHARQGRLFDDDGPADSALHCEVCDEYLTHTPSGYLACPNGHGRLVVAEDCRAVEAEREDSLFEGRLDAGG
jgi:hypothetical protein